METNKEITDRCNKIIKLMRELADRIEELHDKEINRITITYEAEYEYE